MRNRRWIWALAGLVAVLAIAVIAAPSVVRARASAAARARGVEMEIGSVRLGWFRVELRDVVARPEGVADVTVRARALSAKVGLSGPGELEASGVVADANGELATLKSALEAWRARHPSGGGAGGGPGRTYLVRELSAHWHLAGTEPVVAAAREVTLGGSKVVVRGGDVTVHSPGGEIRASGLDTELTRADGRLGGLTVASLAVEIEGPGGLGLPFDAETPAAPVEVHAKTPADAWRLVTRARAAMEKLFARFEPGVELKVAELTLTTGKGEERRTLGPWASRVVLGSEAVALELDPGEKAGRKPLVMRALVPREHGKWTAELKMGPATLAELGIAEGAFGLTDVGTASIEARGSVELDPEEKTFAADGSVSLKGASIHDARLADGTVQGIDVGGRGVLASKGDLTAWTLTGGAIELGKVRFEIEGGVERVETKDGKTGPRLWASWSVPIVPCGDALTSMPRGLLPKLEGMEMQGTFGARGRVGFDARFPEKTEVDLFLDQKCRVTKAPPALSVERFKEPFELRVYDPKGNPKTAKFGPGTPEWVSYEKVSPYVIDALMTCEDGAFFVHNGFSAGAIRNAIIANIKAGKFALGASTISMQLAKNVFLDRRKQLSRKLQEAVLTAWLEQAMSKNEMLELYLNVIEFGPNLYGIGPAAWHWFGRPASDLDPLEATFLVSILPSPVRRHAMWDRGAPGDGYLAYVRSLLKEEHARGKLDDEEYQAALARPLEFHKAGAPLPPPHGIQPAKDPLGKGNVDDAAFDPGGLSPPAD